MFLGEFQHTVDAKGRVSLPARFRDDLAGKLFVAKGFEKCLYVYSASAYDAFLARVTASNAFDAEARKVQRFFTSGAQDAVLDSAGRIMLPPLFREYANLGRDVSIIGNNDHIEIWDVEAWAAYNGDTTEHIEDVAGELVAKGIL
jgi:MraZ protein